MASTINAKNTSTGLVMTPDATGQLELQTADTTRMTITSGGDVGVGTSSPSQKLQIVDGRIALTEVYDVRWLSSGGTLRGSVSADSGSNLYFGTGSSNTERMRIDSSGNVLVGTTTAISTTNTTFGLTAYGQGTIAQYTSADTNSWGRSNNGNVHVFRQGTTTVGNINITASATAYVTSSDYRLKDNITPMTGALEKVALLNPVNWNWKVDGTDGQGFIAHELQAVVPDCVSGEKDAVDDDGNPVYQGVDTSFLVATLTKAIQELKAELDTVKAELAELKGVA